MPPWCTLLIESIPIRYKAPLLVDVNPVVERMNFWVKVNDSVMPMGISKKISFGGFLRDGGNRPAINELFGLTATLLAIKSGIMKLA